MFHVVTRKVRMPTSMTRVPSSPLTLKADPGEAS
jgi:hypothetical protein